MSIIDKSKLNELVERKAQLEKKFEDISDSLANQHESDGWLKEPNKMTQYTKDSLYHGRILGELKLVNDELGRIEALTPKDKSTPEGQLSDAFSRFLLSGTNGLEEAEQNLYLSDGRAGFGPGFKMPLRQEASRSDNATGSALTDITTAGRVIDALDWVDGISKMAQVFTTENGNEYRFPVQSDANEVGVLVTQDEDIMEKRIANFTDVKYGIEDMTTRKLPISRQLVQDSVIDIASYGSREISRRMSRGWDLQFTNGGTVPGEIDGSATATGARAPDTVGIIGVTKVAKAGITTEEAGKVNYMDLVKAVHSVERAYRVGNEGITGLSAESGGQIGWLISDEFEMALKMLTDDQGRPLWQAMGLGLGASGMSPNILGFPYQVSGSMPALSTNSVPALFGNFSYYGIRRVNQLEFFSFFDSNTAQRNNIELVGFSRQFGRAMFPGTPVRGSAANKTAYGGIPQIAKLTIK